jgi:chemotaxis signal transduction protein
MTERPPRAGLSLGVTEAEGSGEQVEVVLFSIGRHHFVAARAAVRAIREPPRARAPAEPGREVIPIVYLSRILGLDRDTAIDRRVLEVEYWDARIGLAVTAIAGIRSLDASSLRPLPSLVARSIGSLAILGLVETDLGWAVALDLETLVTERCEDVLR